jgi:hypothetical protein
MREDHGCNLIPLRSTALSPTITGYFAGNTSPARISMETWRAALKCDARTPEGLHK